VAAPFLLEPVPLATGADGVIRVGGTRVTLETVVGAFRDGATAEEIAQQYPSLGLGAIYQVFAYCLQKPAEVEAYLRRRRDAADAVRQENEQRFAPQGIRDRLLARRAASGG
jgi:uncharacterized protein (DUF433 family)